MTTPAIATAAEVRRRSPASNPSGVRGFPVPTRGTLYDGLWARHTHNDSRHVKPFINVNLERGLMPPHVARAIAELAEKSPPMPDARRQ
jgi:hypothetical protein